MKNRLKLGLLWVGALALSVTLATAEGKCGDSQKGMMNNEGKCDSSKKCDGAIKEVKPAPAKGKCGQGKCG
ncbi:hypothetical protein KJ766_03955 [Patescibacteria group bacterium]|nr:hypothetical protein [Patescibacteria group bacterium]